MRSLFLSLVLLIAVLFPFTQAKSVNVYSSVLHDHVVTFEDERWLCTAFMVATDTFLTANHCIHEPDQVLIDQFNLSYPTDVLRVDPEIDLALLHAHVPTKHPIPFATRVQSEEEVVGVGYVFVLGERHPLPANGHVVTATAYFIAIDTPFRQGFSGGPLVNTKGQLVGLNDATDPAHGIGLAISLDAIKAFLAGNTE